MYVIHARNVAEALPAGVDLLLSRGQRERSRGGDVLVAPWPVTTVYKHPTERVLYSAVRDANPFFHLAESLWMLAGRDDAGFLNNFVSDFGERFAESASGKENWETDGRIHGAYGRRWRSALGHDQLDYVVETLREDPTSRQCVIQMWDAMPKMYIPTGVEEQGYREEFEFGHDDLRGKWRDRPCNTHIYLRVREQLEPDYVGVDSVGLRLGGIVQKVLDVTVCCRSNDAIWGAYGANAVHFSVLQEYLAARIGVGVGKYYQVSNNFHAYVSELERLKQRSKKLYAELPQALRDGRALGTQPLVDDPEHFDGEVATLLALYEGDGVPVSGLGLVNTWLGRTAWPALRAHKLWKMGQRREALVDVDRVQSEDWRAACSEWVQRRLK